MRFRLLMLAFGVLPQLVAAAPQARERVDVLFAVARTHRGEPTHDADAAGRTLDVGEQGTMYLLTGSPGRSLCTRSVGTVRPSAEMIAKAIYLWTAKARVVSAEVDSIVLDIDWTRERVQGDGSLQRVAGDQRTVTFKEGDRHTLDFLASDTPDDECGLSLRIDLGASIKEDPRFEQERIHYEFWLVDQPPHGDAIVRKVETSGKQGERRALAFDPLRWDLAGATFKDGRGAQAAVTFTGEVRGRVREDGTIDVLLRAGRWIGVVEAGDPNRGGIGDGGEKTFTVKSGETVDLALPAISGGSHTMWLDEQRAQVNEFTTPAGREPVIVTPYSVTLNNEAFFAGHAMSLRMTATRIGS